MKNTLISIALVLGVTAVPAYAQVTFPPDDDFLPVFCANAPMTDLFADESGALNERDIVGQQTAAAGLRAGDSTNLYLRMRLEEDPAPGGTLRQFTWGWEFDLDGDRTTYEVLLLVDGIAGAGGSINVYRNTTTTLPNDPNDPADQPAAATVEYAMNGRSVTAAGTSFGGSPDFFLDFAVPWSALVPLGLDHDTPTYVWAATSSSPNSLNGDFACHDGAGGAATLDGTASDPTTGDPNNDPDPGGGGGGTGRLEGGGGCSASTGTGGFGIGLALVVLPLVRRFRRR